MTQFLELNFVEYSLKQDFKVVQSKENICICCLSQNVTFINAVNCEHMDFLQNFVKCKVDYSMAVVCVECHRFLKNIHLFRRQVEENQMKLNEQSCQLTPNKFINLQQSLTTIICSPETLHEITEVKTELTNHNVELQTSTIVQLHDIITNQTSEHAPIKAEYVSEVKTEFEQDNSDLETDLPLSELKKNKRKRKNERPKTKSFFDADGKYNGKVKVITLSKVDVMLERERESLKEGYIKLPFKCKDCIMGFDHEPMWKEHMEKKHVKKEGGYVCELCKSVLSSSLSYKEHVKRHYKRYECEACGKKNNTALAVFQHYQNAHGGPRDNYTCEECGYITESYRRFRYHKDKHRTKAQCTECGNTFASTTGLKMHMYNVHKQSSRRFACDKCDKVYQSRSGLYTHLATSHDGTSAAYCAECRTHFRSKDSLKHHLKVHSAHVTDSDKRFVCDECGAKFLTKSSLRGHIDWVHLKCVKYECDKCHKVFKNDRLLRRHASYVHDKVRPPRDKICDHCGRGFFTLSILQSHIRTHTGERPLQCTHCPANFAHKAALYTHNKLLHSARNIT